MSDRRTVVALIAILLVAFALRLGFAAGVVGLSRIGKGDEADYHVIARHLAEGRGFTDPTGHVTGRRPPLYPVLLAVLYRVGGVHKSHARLVQVLLGVAVVLLVFALARQRFGATVGLAAAAIAAYNPFLVFISGYILTENLFMTLLLAALVVFGPPARERTARRSLAAGALLGLATLTRPTGLPMAAWVAASAPWALRDLPWRRRVRDAALVAATCLVVVAPWMVRNARAFGGWVGLTTHGGITFFQGNNPKVVDIPHYRGGVAPLEALPRYDALVRADERTRDRLAWRMGREFLRHHWRDLPRMAWWKFHRFWRLGSDMGISGVRAGWWFPRESIAGRIIARVDVGRVWSTVVFTLFGVGLWRTRRRARELVDLYGVVLVHTGVAIVFFGSIRGRIPVEPVIACFAAVALAGALSAWRPRRRGPAPGSP